jgi:hypothetical protein
MDGPTQDDLLRVIDRDRAVKEMLAQRLAGMLLENAELVAMVRELQDENQRLITMADGEQPVYAEG